VLHRWVVAVSCRAVTARGVTTESSCAGTSRMLHATANHAAELLEPTSPLIPPPF
jgi:hypothetical protein